MLIGALIVAGYIGFCAVTADSMVASQHDVAAQYFLQALHKELLEYRQDHGHWPSKE